MISNRLCETINPTFRTRTDDACSTNGVYGPGGCEGEFGRLGGLVEERNKSCAEKSAQWLKMLLQRH